MIIFSRKEIEIAERVLDGEIIKIIGLDYNLTLGRTDRQFRRTVQKLRQKFCSSPVCCNKEYNATFSCISLDEYRLYKKQWLALIDLLEDKDFIEDTINNKIETSIDITSPILRFNITYLNLSPRSLRRLNSANIWRIIELIQKKETMLLKIPTLGEKTLNEIKTRLGEHSLCLEMVIQN